MKKVTNILVSLVAVIVAQLTYFIGDIYSHLIILKILLGIVFVCSCLLSLSAATSFSNNESSSFADHFLSFSLVIFVVIGVSTRFYETPEKLISYQSKIFKKNQDEKLRVAYDLQRENEMFNLKGKVILEPAFSLTLAFSKIYPVGLGTVFGDKDVSKNTNVFSSIQECENWKRHYFSEYDNRTELRCEVVK